MYAVALPGRLPRWALPWLDRALAIGVTLVLGAFAYATSRNFHSVFGRDVAPGIFALTQGIPLAWRRQRPLEVLSFVVATDLLLWAIAGTRPAPLSPMIVLYTAAAERDRRTSLRAFGIAALVGFPYVLDTATHLQGSKIAFQMLRLGFQAATLAAAWFAGEMVQARTAYLTELEDRAARAERERETEAARAVAEEKARIARELHDVIAHDVSLMVVQAGAAEEVFDDRPSEARAALRRIDEAGRDALRELRRLLGTVLTGDAELEPQPSLERLDEVIERVRASGLRVTVEIDGSPRPLPAGIDLSAYRIVQEALTNVVRHAHATETRVAIAYMPRALELSITDNGRGASNGPRAHGSGIVGMRERAALVGGTVEASPASNGGFLVRAVLPLEGGR